jgi:hypothetical protein
MTATGPATEPAPARPARDTAPPAEPAPPPARDTTPPAGPAGGTAAPAVVGRRAGVGAIADPVGRADRLRRELGARVLVTLAPADGAVGDLYVGWFAALEARACPARFRAQGEEGWGFPGWSAANAGPAIARAALHRHLDQGRPPGREPALPHPLTLVREWMAANRPAADTSVGAWVAERMDVGDGPTLAAAAANAVRWLAGVVRALGWPLPPGLALAGGGRDAGPPATWRPERGSPVKVVPGADARLGRVRGSGDFAVLVHRPVVSGDDRLRDRAAFEATAAAVAIGVVPARVLVTAGDTGDRIRLPVDEALLSYGADLVAGVVEQRVAATAQGWSAADATPSAACRHCPLVPSCPPGTAWMAGPGRWRGGLPRLTSPALPAAAPGRAVAGPVSP